MLRTGNITIKGQGTEYRGAVKRCICTIPPWSRKKIYRKGIISNNEFNQSKDNLIHLICTGRLMFYPLIRGIVISCLAVLFLSILFVPVVRIGDYRSKR